MRGLSARAVKIIGILNEAAGYLTIARIAEALEVSTRTILRELKSVEEQLSERGITVESRQGIGVRLVGTPEALAALAEEMKLAGPEAEYTPRERQAYLLVELLNASEPLKLYYFTSVLKVSEGTISNDLDKIEPILAGWHLRLIRKPGYGIEVEGDEKQFRTAISHLIFEHFSRGELLEIIRRKYQGTATRPDLSSVRNRLLNTIGDDLLEGIEEAIGKTEALKRYPIADNSYVGLVVHMALAVKRLMNGERITFDPTILEELRESREYDIARSIVLETGKIFNIPIPEDETGYITMHLKGVKYGNTFKGSGKIHVNDYRIIHLAEDLIRRVQQDTGYFLQDNERLLTGLVNHLGPAVARIQMGLEIHNPLLEEIQSRYRNYYELTARHMGLLEERLGFEVPPDEIGYLAMHFGAALEELTRKVHRSYRVVTVCSTGIGSSKLLEARILKHYDNLRIVESRSALDLAAFLKGRQDIDFIISTVGVQGVDRPIAVVSPLLLEQDMERINRILAALSLEAPHGGELTEDTEDFITGAEALGQLAGASASLLKGFRVLNLRVWGKEALIRQAGFQLAEESVRESVIQALLDRERTGSTVFDGGRGLLLHGRAKGLEEPLLAVAAVAGDEGWQDLPEAMAYCVIMVAPERMTEAQRTVLGEISRNLAENPVWAASLRQGNAVDIRRQLERILGQLLRDHARAVEN